jgi:hypothetical protein
MCSVHRVSASHKGQVRSTSEGILPIFRTVEQRILASRRSPAKSYNDRAVFQDSLGGALQSLSWVTRKCRGCEFVEVGLGDTVANRVDDPSGCLGFQAPGFAAGLACYLVGCFHSAPHRRG